MPDILRRRLRDAVGGDHHEPGVQQVGVGVRGRPDGRRRDRPHCPPREARPVPRRVLLRPPCPHAGGLAAQKACAPPMLRLPNFRCSFCSNPLDETHLVDGLSKQQELVGGQARHERPEGARSSHMDLPQPPERPPGGTVAKRRSGWALGQILCLAGKGIAFGEPSAPESSPVI